MSTPCPTGPISGACSARSTRRRWDWLSACGLVAVLLGLSGGGVLAEETKEPASDQSTPAAARVINDSAKQGSGVLPTSPINETPRVGPGEIIAGGGVRFIFYPRGKDRSAYQFDPKEKVPANRSNPSIKEGEQVFHRYSGIMLKGVALFKDREYEEAFETFRMATEVITRDPTSRMYAAHALLAMGDYGGAVSFIREALTLGPDILKIDWDVRGLYGPSVNAQKDYHKHMGRLRRRMATTPPNTDLKILLAYAYLFSQKPQEAVKLIDRAKRRAKDDRLLLSIESRCRQAALLSGAAGDDVAQAASP